MSKTKMAILFLMIFPSPPLFSATLEEALTSEIGKLFEKHCPKECLDVQVKVNSQTTVRRSFAEPGFEETGGRSETSSSLVGIKVNILVDSRLSDKAKDFLKGYVEYLGQRYQAPIEVNYTAVSVPKNISAVFKNEGRLLSIALLVLALGLVIWLLRRKRQMSFRSPMSFRAPKERGISREEKNSKSDSQIADDSLPERGAPEKGVEPLFSTRPSFQTTDISLASLVSENLETVKRILSKWATTPEGLSRTVQLLIQLPPYLRHELKGILGERPKEQLRVEYAKAQSISHSELSHAVQDLRREVDFENLLLVSQAKEEDDTFKFLDHFDAVKIVHLIRDEDVKNKALILMQLDLEKRSAVFHSFSLAEQKKIALELGNVEALHWGQLKELSARLSVRAAQLMNLDLYETSGFQSLVRLVELNENPDKFVSEVSQADIQLGNRLRTNMVTLGLVEWLEDDELTLYLSHFTRDELVALLIGRLGAYKDLILPKLSKQIVEYVNFNLDPEFVKKISAKKVKEAEQKAYASLRTLFQSGQFNLEEINKRKKVWEAPGFSGVQLPGVEKTKPINV